MGTERDLQHFLIHILWHLTSEKQGSVHPMKYACSLCFVLGVQTLAKKFASPAACKQSGTKPNLVARILATNFGNLWA